MLWSPGHVLSGVKGLEPTEGLPSPDPRLSPLNKILSTPLNMYYLNVKRKLKIFDHLRRK